ncbi:alpha/beta hydrolase [Pseudorhodoferax sp.]|uniref:alpha/beta hydrolase n=1 Tax=Pseudorhodoferax sp. TaxID=1993553 RepID=UPI002DD69538|nr:alpha/beta hydrolase [Pseudorhodoferax sp.]
MNDLPIDIERDIIYGSGCIHFGTAPVARPLYLDRYAPAEPPTTPRPVLVMAFGGAFHRGNRRDDEFGDSPQRNTPVSAYCEMAARRGWVACSIDYRLVPEDPDPGNTPVIGSPEHVPMSRVALVRRWLGLAPTDAATICRGIEAATDDMVQAFRFLQDQAQAWSINPDCIVIGGFSAGARIALGAAYGERLPAAGVVALSGYLADDDLRRGVTGTPGEPPALLVHGDDDLDYIVRQAPAMDRRFAQAGRGSECWKVPGAGHFYPAQSPARRSDGHEATVDQAVSSFLARLATDAASRKHTDYA